MGAFSFPHLKFVIRGDIITPQPQQKQEVEQVVKEPQEADTKEEEVIRNTFQ